MAVDKNLMTTIIDDGAYIYYDGVDAYGSRRSPTTKVLNFTSAGSSLDGSYSTGSTAVGDPFLADGMSTVDCISDAFRTPADAWDKTLPLTIEQCINIDTLDATNDRIIVCNWWTGNTVFKLEQENTGASGALKLSYYDSSSVLHTITGTTTLAVDTPYHIVITFDATNGATLYLNGEVEGTDSNGTFQDTPTSAFRVVSWAGFYSGFTTATSFDGQMSKCAIYKSELTADQVSDHHDKALSNTLQKQYNALLDTLGVKAHWPLGDAGNTGTANFEEVYARQPDSYVWDFNADNGPTMMQAGPNAEGDMMSIYCDGTTTCVVKPNTATPIGDTSGQNQAEQTIVMWVKVDEATPGVDEAHNYFGSFGTVGQSNAYLQQNNTTGYFRWGQTGTGTVLESTDNPMTAGEWHMLAATKSTSGSFRAIYLDAVEIASDTSPQTFSGTAAEIGVMCRSSNNGGTNDRHTPGYVSNVAWFGTALSQEDLQSLYDLVVDYTAGGGGGGGGKGGGKAIRARRRGGGKGGGATGNRGGGGSQRGRQAARWDRRRRRLI
jgi:hypothetical protein